MAAAELYKSVLLNNANLKAYYRFESGALTTDSSGQGKTLTNVNTAVDGTGVYGGAVDLGSTNSTKYLYIANDLGITGGACTVSIWVKNNSDIGSGAWKFWTQGDAGTFVDFQVAYEYNSGTRRLQFRRIRRGTSTADFAYNLTMGTSNWYHIVQTYDGTTVRGYVNGAYVGSVASSGNGASNTVDGFNVGADGSDQSGGTLSAYCSSIFDDVAVFDAALSADQIKELYEGRYLGELRPNQFGTTTALYHLSSTTDFSGNNRHLTNNNTVGFVSGKFSNCADFGASNTNKYLTYTADSMGLTNTGSKSYVGWIKIQTAPTTGQNQYIFDHFFSDATREQLVYRNSGGTLQLYAARNGQGGEPTGTYNVDLGTTLWHQVGFVFNNTTFKVYLNGNEVISTSATGAAASGATPRFYMGADVNAANLYKGYMDEFYLPSTALTAIQIRTMYALGKGLYY